MIASNPCREKVCSPSAMRSVTVPSGFFEISNWRSFKLFKSRAVFVSMSFT